MSTMNTGVSHLFVYGTLKSAAMGAMGKAQRDRLQREGRSLGAAILQSAPSCEQNPPGATGPWNVSMILRQLAREFREQDFLEVR